MQNQNDHNLPKRSRYHQAEMDLSSLKPGQDFNELQPSVIIFICTFDPFGLGLYRYTFENRCLEADFPLGDETKKIFLNTKGSNAKDIPDDLVNFLRYVENTTDTFVDTVDDCIIKEIHSRISQLKRSRSLEDRYMRFEELLKREHSNGYVEGKAEATCLILKLTTCMINDGLQNDISRLSTDIEFFENMLKKYNL